MRKTECTELYECVRCGRRWKGEAGPQVFSHVLMESGAPSACPYCPSLYCVWLTFPREAERSDAEHRGEA